MVNNLEQGFFGIGIQNGKTPENLGVLWRSAQNMGASFIFTIGNRYAKQACDTHKATGAMPYFHYDTFDDFYNNIFLLLPILLFYLFSLPVRWSMDDRLTFDDDLYY